MRLFSLVIIFSIHNHVIAGENSPAAIPDEAFLAFLASMQVVDGELMDALHMQGMNNVQDIHSKMLRQRRKNTLSAKEKNITDNSLFLDDKMMILIKGEPVRNKPMTKTKDLSVEGKK